MGIQALLVGGQSNSLDDLKKALQRLSITTHQVRTCGEASQFVAGGMQGGVIFSDIELPDGSWADLVNMTRRENCPAETIVVSRLPDTKLYIEVMEQGGFDFITPPFTLRDLRYLIDCAIVDASKRWGGFIRGVA